MKRLIFVLRQRGEAMLSWVRCYNGCPDSGLQRELDERERIRKEIKARGYHVTYFPNGEFYTAFDARHLPVTGECKTLAEVLRTLPAAAS